MTDDNPIVAEAAQRAAGSPLDGAGMAKDAADLVTKVASGDWTEGLVSLASLAYETKDLLTDPLAKLAGVGLGWAIEFFSPLRWLLDQLTGNQEQLNQYVETWSGIADEMAAAADDLHAHHTADSAGWTGPAVAQYRLFCANQVDLYRAAAAAARSVADNARMSGTVLTVVREIVRGLVTDAVGKTISIACRYPPPTTLAAAPEIAGTVLSTGSRIADWLRKLGTALANASELLARSGGLFRQVRAGLRTAGMLSSSARRGAMRAAVVDEGAAIVRDAAKQAVKELPGRLPEKVVVEGAKGAANTAAGMSSDERQQDERLYDGPGPHRVTGTL